MIGGVNNNKPKNEKEKKGDELVSWCFLAQSTTGGYTGAKGGTKQ